MLEGLLWVGAADKKINYIKKALPEETLHQHQEACRSFRNHYKVLRFGNGLHFKREYGLVMKTMKLSGVKLGREVC